MTSNSSPIGATPSEVEAYGVSCLQPGIHDVAFLHLAVAGKARALVSGDRDLLALAGAPGLCPILGVDAFCRQYLGD